MVRTQKAIFMNTVRVFAEGVAKQISNYLPEEFQNMEFTVVENTKNLMELWLVFTLAVTAGLVVVALVVELVSFTIFAPHFIQKIEVSSIFSPHLGQ